MNFNEYIQRVRDTYGEQFDELSEKGGVVRECHREGYQVLEAVHTIEWIHGEPVAAVANLPRDFNQGVAMLQAIKDSGRKCTDEWNQVLAETQRLNPGSTPIGFYLD